MIQWAPFPFVRFTLALIAGILLGLKFEEIPVKLFWFFWPALALYIGLFFLARYRRAAIWFSVAGIWGLVCLVMAGWGLTQLRNQKNDPGHLLHQPGTVTHYQGYVNDFLQEKPSVFQTTFRLQQVRINGQWQPANGQVQLSFRKDDGLAKPGYGDVLLIKGPPREVAAPLNPGQFDYRKFFGAKNIYHQHFLAPGQFQKTGQHVRNPVYAFTIQLRNSLNQLLKQYISGKREYGIASALVLGIKDDLDNTVKAAFTNTGAMHVLAVSGLHVGMLFQILTGSFKRSRVLERQKWVKALLILSIIWTYAFITALSPSVLRATIMFSFIVGAGLVGRRGNIYNTLAAAAFLLLCINPFYLLEVGFQLSFMAVLSIVFLQPKIYNLYTFRNWFLNKVWLLISVSLAAQLGTMFISLAFFHQFPVYFLPANLVAVPAAFLILNGGFGLLLFGWVPYLGKAIGYCLEWVVWALNEFMLWADSLPGAVINRIPFSGWQAVLSYGVLFLVFVFLARKKLRYLALATLVLAVFTGSRLAEAYSAANRKLIIFAVPKQPVWAMLENQTATMLADSAFAHDKKAQSFTLEPALMQSRIKQTNFLPWQDKELVPANLSYRPGPEINLLVWHGIKLLALKKTLPENLQKPAEADYLALQQNVWFTPEYLQRNFRFKKVILDSSNDQWYWQRAQKQLLDAGIPFHNVNRQGAFVLEQ